MQTRDGRPVLGGPAVLPGPADSYIAYGRSWANVSNTPFREYKHWVHEGGISTPLIAHWPGGIPAARNGSIENQPGHLIDIMATCLDVAGAKYPKKYHGREITPPEGKSLVPAFLGEPIARGDALYWEHEGNRAVRRGKWKLVAKGWNGKWELYDMEADRTEMHDLSGEKPDLARELAEKWDAWAHRARVLPWPWGKKERLSEKNRFQLREGADLPRRRAPNVGGRSFRLTARVEKTGEGVIIAQGGTAHGYALYLDAAGKISVALRHGGELATYSSPEAAPGGPYTLVLDLGMEGKLTVSLNERTIIQESSAGPLKATPQDGCQVGVDGNDPVGDYPRDYRFTGKIKNVRVELGPVK
jgi:arylsulfatase